MDQTTEELKDYLIKEVLDLANMNSESIYRHRSTHEAHTGLKWVTNALKSDSKVADWPKSLEEILSELSELTELAI